MGIIGRMKTGAMLTSAVANSAFSFALRAFVSCRCARSLELLRSKDDNYQKVSSLSLEDKKKRRRGGAYLDLKVQPAK